MATPARDRRARRLGPKKHQTPQRRPSKRKREDVDAEQLETAVQELDLNSTYTNFTELPLSAPTVAGLKAAHFSTLTDIQGKAIPLALRGRDILGAAKTGSGKTLAFIVPVLENLFRAQCVGSDAGLGAMIIAPTRELAIQIFEVLRTVGGKGHFFAAGLIIGGKSLKEEQDALARMNIVVGTPGRILQHLSQTAMFSVDNLRMLVLDEADRIMDMGFQKDVDAIVEYLPPDRQTLLFSATQTKRVSDLSRLALKEPEYVSVHEAAASATPKTLQQNYVVTPLPEKLDTLWSFLQASKKSKILVFFSSGKQVRFVYESFRHMQPGIPLLHLLGRQKQTTRLEIAQKFSRAKNSCLFATDVVARGLDFPAVDWVIQVDCPEDPETYIHRVGRTARYEKEGRAVLFLDPSEEEGMLKKLEAKSVPIERINVRQKKQQSIKNQLQSMCFQDPSLKYLGQKAFSSYVRSLHIQKDKKIFKLEKYPLEEFAASLGLPGAPRIKFLKADADEVKRLKNAPRQQMALSDSDEVDEGNETSERAKVTNGVRTKYDRMFERKNQDILADHYSKMIRDDDDSNDSNDDGRDNIPIADEDDDDLFAVKRRIAVDESLDSDISMDDDDEVASADPSSGPRQIQIPGAKTPLVLDSKRREKLFKSKKKLLKLKDKGSKLVFDDDGRAHPIYELEDEETFRARGAAEDQRYDFLAAESERVRVADIGDKALAKEKRREKKERRKERERLEAKGSVEDGGLELNEDGEHGVDALQNFLDDARSESGSAEESEEEMPLKRGKKWFEEDGKRAKAAASQTREIETLDDLEAEAARLLG